MSEDLPRGSFGAGGWSPGGKGSYPRLSHEEAAFARRIFRQRLLKKYHSMARAWVGLDLNGDGRLSFYEFCRACQRLGLVYNPRQLWDAMDMDRNGFVTVDEVDPDFSDLLGGFCAALSSKFQYVEDAWRSCFNRRGSVRVDFEHFSMACKEVGYTGDHCASFEALSADKATTGINRREFSLLELWMGKDPDAYSTPLHPCAEQEALARAGDPLDMMHHPYRRKKQHDVSVSDGAGTLAEFKKLLIDSYGNFARAWRKGLDYDHNGRLDYNELQMACKDIGFAGDRKQLWNEIDCDINGIVTLREIDEETADLLEDLNRHAAVHYGSWQIAFRSVMDVRDDDRVGRQEFVEGCEMLGYAGPAEQVFELLDMDRARYLTQAGTSWIDGIEDKVPVTPEKETLGGDFFLTGKFKGVTRSQARRMEDKERDLRLQRQRFEVRNRVEAMQAGRGSHFSSMQLSGGHSSLSGSSSLPSLRMANTQVGMFPTAYVSEREPLVGASPLKARRPAMAHDLVPGKGGWPTKPMRVVDPTWGGSQKVERIQELLNMMQEPKRNKLCAVPSAHLHKWQSGIVEDV